MKFNCRKDIFKSYYLNLERRRDRRETTEEKFHNLSINVERICAVDGLKLDNDPVYANTLGHVIMWANTMNLNAPCAIYEDDVVFCDDFSNFYENTVLEIPFKIDVLFLGMSWSVFSDPVDGISRVNDGFGTFSYILFPSGAIKLLQEFKKAPNIPSDHISQKLILNGELNAYIPNPFWCVSGMESDIDVRLNSGVRFGKNYIDYHKLI